MAVEKSDRLGFNVRAKLFKSTLAMKVYVRLDLKFRDIYTKPYTFSFIKIRKWLWKITVFDQFLVLLFAEKINELALKLLKK